MSSSASDPPFPLPEFVYKIITDPPPSPIPAEYPLSDLDAQDGFIHLSTAWQVNRPLSRPLFLFILPSLAPQSPPSPPTSLLPNPLPLRSQSPSSLRPRHDLRLTRLP